MTIKRKKIFWLSPVKTHALEQKIIALLASGYEVILCEDKQHFLLEFSRLRAGIVLVSDNYPQEAKALSDLRFLANMHELSGVRFILTPERGYINCMSFSACLGFRDIIPLELDNDLWMSRFLYSTSGAPSLWAEPLGKISLDEPCKITTPGRLVWFGEKEMRIECKLEPVMDVPIRITGPIVKALDAEAIRFYPTEIQKQNLVYRFSRAIKGKYHIEKGSFTKVQEVLGNLDGNDYLRRCKVFLAISSGKLRKEVLAELDSGRFDVSVALHRHSISSDPIYFCPHVILLEDQVCQGINQPEFEALLQHVGKSIPLIILGKNIDEEKWRRNYPTHKLFFEDYLPIDFAGLVFNKYLNVGPEEFLKRRESRGHISGEHDFSFVNIHFDGKLTQIHPLSLTLTSEANLLPYSLCKVRALSLTQRLKSDPYLKVTDSYYHAGTQKGLDKKEIHGYICTANKKDGMAIAELAREILMFQMKDYFVVEAPGPKIARDVKPAEQGRTLEKNVVPTGVEPQEHARFSLKEALYWIRDYWLGEESQTLRYFLVFALVTGFAIGLIWGISSALAPQYEKSGKQYTEELEKFKKFFGH